MELTRTKHRTKQMAKISVTTPPKSTFADQEKNQAPSTVFGSFPELDDHFNVIRKIGEGTFSCVYLATVKKQYGDHDKIALKYIVPTTHPFRVESELKCLRDFGGKNNVIGLLFSHRYANNTILAMPYFPHDRFVEYFHHMSVREIQLYMKNLLVALKHVHENKIIHRDIKPSNYLYNRRLQKFLLVDFGLAHRSDVEWVPLQNRCFSNEKQATETKDMESTNKRKLEKDENSFSRNPSIKSPLKKRTHLGTLTSNDLNMASASTPLAKSLINTSLTIATNITIGFKRLLPTVDQPAKHNNIIISNLEKSKKPVDAFRNAQRQPNGRNDCQCYRKNQVCKICLKRKGQIAPRAGTPGFRAPEVLLKHPQQTTAVDVWSAGVIFLCLLSRSYPFFSSADDLVSLAEIMTLFGDSAVKALAQKLDKVLINHPSKPALNLRKLCQRLRNGKTLLKDVKQNHTCNACKQSILQNSCVCATNQNNERSLYTVMDDVPSSAYDLLYRLLTLDPDRRITAADALHHPFILNELD